jgi:hypothetical protein
VLAKPEILMSVVSSANLKVLIFFITALVNRVYLDRTKAEGGRYRPQADHKKRIRSSYVFGANQGRR